MIKISKNFLYTVIIAILGFILFLQSNFVSYRPVYVRAEHLEIFSVEFAALTGFFIFITSALIKFKGYLHEKFIIGYFASIILTDSVYRFGFVQLSDIFLFLSVFSYNLTNLLVNRHIVINKAFLNKPPAFLMAGTVLACLFSLISPGIGYFYENLSIDATMLNLTSCVYFLKIIFLFLFCHLLYTVSLSNKTFIKQCLNTLVISGLIGCAVYWIQIGLFYFNLCDVNGIFNDFGFPRAKGLAHEPATFAHSLLFIAVLTFYFSGKLNKKIALLIITIIATFSLGTYVTAVSVIFFYYLIKYLKNIKNLRLLSGLSFVSLIAIASVSSLSMFVRIFDKLLYHIQYKIFESNCLIDSLFNQYTSIKFFGIGLLNSVMPFVDTLEVRNSYLLLYQDTGFFGFSLFLIILIFNIVMCIINSSNNRKILFSAYILSFCLISLNVIRMIFFPYLWIALTLFYIKNSKTSA